MAKQQTLRELVDGTVMEQAIHARSPLCLSAEAAWLIQRAARAHGTPDDVVAWARQLAEDVRRLSD